MRVSSKGRPVIDKETWLQVSKAYCNALLDLTALQDMPGIDPESEAGREIQALRNKYASLALVHLSIAKDKKPGRPKLPEAAGQGIIGSVQRRSPAKGPVGRPSKRPKGWDALVFDRVEARRQELATGNITKPTLAAAMQLMLREDVAKSRGASEFATIKRYWNKTKAAYYRGKQDRLGRVRK